MKYSLLLSLAVMAVAASAMAEDSKSALDFEMKTLQGEKAKLSQYKGKVLLVVNTASECGLTPQYETLQTLYKTHEKDGLVVIGFPCNQFGGQEPGSAKEISEFCTTEYGISFPMFAKVDVNGKEAAPLYKYLTSLETKPKGSGKIQWNFEKFLINRKGEVVARFSPRTKPDSPEVLKAISAELKKD